jgi:hypothetical protein
MRKWIGNALLLGTIALIPADLVAQRRPAPRRAAATAHRPSFGLQLDVGTESDIGIGGRGVFGLQALFPRTPLSGIVSFDYFFPSGAPAGINLTYWEINGNVAYRFRMPPRSSLGAYAGGGLNIAHASVSGGGGSGGTTKAGLNLLAGTTFKVSGSKLTPFLEGRGIIGGGKQVVFTGGVRF